MVNSKKIRNFKDLKIWQESVEFVEEISVFGIAEPVPREARNLLSLLTMTVVYVLY